VPTERVRLVPPPEGHRIHITERGLKVPDVPNVCEICGQPSQIATPEQYGEAIQEHFHKKEAGSQ